MRERWARRLAALTGLMVVILAASFAAIHTDYSSQRADAAEGEQALVGIGKQLFEDQGCVRCHSVAGVGSPRSPLDGVGSKLSRAEIRGRIIATADQQDFLPPAVFRAKQQFQKLPEAEIDALVAYMQSLR